MKGIKARTIYFLFFVFFILIISNIFPKLDSTFTNFFETFYWAIVTSSTVGYGDLYPHTKITKIMTMILILLSTIAVSLFTAIVTNSLIQKTIFRKREWEKMKNLNNHLIICGYKSQFKTLLKNFLKSNARFNIDGIVIINEELTPTIEAILEEMEKIKFVKGDFSEEEILIKAKTHNASKAIIIGEQDENSDSKVLATSILLKSLNKNIYVIAEISNPKFERYLEKIECDEIILNEEYNKHLLSKAISDPGISKVIGNLIKDKNFKIIDSPKIGVTYKEIFDEMLQKNILLFGVIENYGNLKQLKKEYVKEANKSPNINELYKKIHQLQEIKINKVILTPKNDYFIKEHSAIIILERE